MNELDVRMFGAFFVHTPKPSLKASSTAHWGTDWWWHTYNSRGCSSGRRRLKKQRGAFKILAK